MLGNAEKNAALAAFSEKLHAKAQAEGVAQQPETPTQQEKVQVETQQVPPDAKTVEPETTKEVTTPAAAEPPKEQPETTAPEVDAGSWDADVPTSNNTTTPEASKSTSIFDFNRLGSALELGEVKDESELIGKINEIKRQNQELQTKPLVGVPDEFQDLVKIAKAGGNWKDYLIESVTDFNKVDPIQLYEDAMFDDNKTNPKFFVDGKFNQDLFEEEMAKVPDVVKMSAGKQLQKMYADRQQNAKAKIAAIKEQRIATADKSLINATQRIGELLPFEKFGVKFEGRHTSELYKGITNSSLVKRHFGDAASYEALVDLGWDMEKISKTLMVAENAEKMIGFTKRTAEASAKRSLLEKTQNVDIKNNGVVATPNAAQKQVTVQDHMNEWKAKQKGPFSI